MNDHRSDTLQKDFEKLQTDLKAIQDKSQVTPAMLAAVRNDVQALQKSSTSAPDKTAVDTLNKDLAGPATARRRTSRRAARGRIGEAVIKSTGADSDATVTKLEGDLNAVAQAMNITSDDVATKIQADQKAIANDGGRSSPAAPRPIPSRGPPRQPRLRLAVSSTDRDSGNGGPGRTWSRAGE